MANLTASQKKKRNDFVALLIGIIVVLAAIVLVTYAGIMAKSAYLVNGDLATALGEIHGEAVRSVSKEDLAAAKYVEVYYDAEYKQAAIAIGYDDFLAKYYEAENSDATLDEAAQALLKSAVFEADDDSVFDDLKYFTGAEVINLINVKVTDPAMFSSFTSLKRGAFTSCGITDVSAFASLDLTKIEELNFSGNTIEDWTALESISDKVIVESYQTLELTEEGTIELDENGQFATTTVETTLTEHLAEKAAEEEGTDNAEEGTEGTESSDESTSEDNAEAENADETGVENEEAVDTAENTDAE